MRPVIGRWRGFIPLGYAVPLAFASNAKDDPEIVATDHDGASQPVTVIDRSEDHGAEHWPARLQHHRRQDQNKSGCFYSVEVCGTNEGCYLA